MRLQYLTYQDTRFFINWSGEDVAAGRAFVLLHIADGADGGNVSDSRNRESLIVFASVRLAKSRYTFFGASILG